MYKRQLLGQRTKLIDPNAGTILCSYDGWGNLKKQTKATNFQSIEILPLMQVNKNLVFKKNYRNIFVLSLIHIL